MKTADLIAKEARTLPENLAREVLDFIHFLEQKFPVGRSGRTGTPQWDRVRLDTRGWHFDREEANARK